MTLLITDINEWDDMTNDNQQPDEPGWNHRPGDPDDMERWWTGADWSEYTRPVPQTASGAPEAVEVDATDTQAVVETDDTAIVSEVVEASTVSAVTGAEYGQTEPSDPPPPAWDPGSTPEADAGAPAWSLASAVGAATTSTDVDQPGTTPPSYGSVPPGSTPPGSVPPGSTMPGSAAAYGAVGAPDPGFGAQGAVPSGAPSDGDAIPPSVFAGWGGGGGGSRAAGFLDRLRDGADSGESGWDRNLATFPWIPVLNVISLVAYALSGSQMSRHARSHIMGSINYFISVSLTGFFMGVVFTARQTGVPLGLFAWLVLTAAFAGVVYLLTKRDGDGVGPIPYWVWFGIWTFVALIAAVFQFGAVTYWFVFGPLQTLLLLVNLVRGRVGLQVNFLGYPVLPILSQR